MDQGTARDNSGIERSVVIRRSPGRAVYGMQELSDGALAIDLPNEDAPTPMNRVNKPLERSSLPRPQANPVLCELLESLHSRFHGQRVVIIAIDQDRERSRKARSSQLLAVSQRTTMTRVRRQDMHQHVVIRL